MAEKLPHAKGTPLRPPPSSPRGKSVEDITKALRAAQLLAFKRRVDRFRPLATRRYDRHSL